MSQHNPNADFYDGLAENYHRMYDDWWAFATDYTEVLAGLLATEGVDPPAKVLDVTCGIGTQALPLAAKGYRVTGSDLSGRAVQRARQEAAARGLDVELVTHDVRRIADHGGRDYDAAISGSNSLTHLLTDEDLRQALTSTHRCLRPGGVFLATIRDYDRLADDNVQGLAPEMFGSGDNRSIVVQAWDWAQDRRTLTAHHIMLLKKRNREGWDTTVRTIDYRALRRAEFDAALKATGFADVRWFFPDHQDPQGMAPGQRSSYYQPVVVARAA
ncbi:class I SAM-dependent methyltransferase (plasmid) [Streptomyces sp. NBC_01343]|uniref:class I SAM-dependent DNA methyltransferase n=1 Tax=Streptomyces sp. NBC_01343 TaxID=2903832 RepID=UPI002E0E9FA9|nr:class I SAM-dependent methyltransferase [Streptomyces sp. NBC_01343]